MMTDTILATVCFLLSCIAVMHGLRIRRLFVVTMIQAEQIKSFRQRLDAHSLSCYAVHKDLMEEIQHATTQRRDNQKGDMPTLPPGSNVD
jgi:hypothetical protein